jgi:hypothetical protein
MHFACGGEEERAILILGCGDSGLEDNAGPAARLMNYGEL